MRVNVGMWAKWLYHPCHLWGPQRSMWDENHNCLSHPCHFGGPHVCKGATSPLSTLKIPNAQRGHKNDKWCNFGGPRVGKELEHFWLEKFSVGKDFVGNCGATINKYCHFPPLPPIPPHFSLFPNGEEWKLPTPPLRSQAHDKKCICAVFGPRTSYFPIKTPENVPFPLIPPPILLVFSIFWNSVLVTFPWPGASSPWTYASHSIRYTSSTWQQFSTAFMKTVLEKG